MEDAQTAALGTRLGLFFFLPLKMTFIKTNTDTDVTKRT